MIVDPPSGPSGRLTPLRPPLCADCPAYDLNLCHPLSPAGEENASSGGASLQWSEQTIPARRVICREKDLHDDVLFICDGWAASAIALSDGRRQILSFLLPGEMVSTALLFEPRALRLIESITPVRYRTFNRAEVKNRVFACPDLLDKFFKIWTEEKLRSDELAVDLGRRMADERLARLILNMTARLERRGMTQGQTIDFPLRQHHIADAAGLTAVHVNKTLADFRQKRLIEIGDRSLTILNPAELCRIADM